MKFIILRPWSYKDLPKRYAEFGTVYRYEQSGELHGLTRVRGFTQDDAHIFCTPDQLDAEFKNVIDLVLYVFGSLGFENFTAQVSVRDLNNPDKYIGSVENWEKAENAIISAAKDKGLNYVIEAGEAAFYGPKLDFMVKDALGRSWQLGTIQVDYNLPERFELTYKGSDDKLHQTSNDSQSAIWFDGAIHCNFTRTYCRKFPTLVNARTSYYIKFK